MENRQGVVIESLKRENSNTNTVSTVINKNKEDKPGKSMARLGTPEQIARWEISLPGTGTNTGTRGKYMREGRGSKRKSGTCIWQQQRSNAYTSGTDQELSGGNLCP